MVRVTGARDGLTQLLQSSARVTFGGGGGGRKWNVCRVYAGDVIGAVGTVERDDCAWNECEVCGQCSWACQHLQSQIEQ